MQLVVGALPLDLATAYQSLLPQDMAFVLEGRPALQSEWYNDTVAGAALGVSLAILALWPRALSTPDAPLATQPPPDPPEPPDPPDPGDPPTRPAPEAVAVGSPSQ